MYISSISASGTASSSGPTNTEFGKPSRLWRPESRVRSFQFPRLKADTKLPSILAASVLLSYVAEIETSTILNSSNDDVVLRSILGILVMIEARMSLKSMKIWHFRPHVKLQAEGPI